MVRKSLSASTILKRKNGLLTQSINDDIVIMHPERGEYFGLKVPGTRIWDLLDEPTSCQAIVDVLVNEFEGERSVIERDVLHLLQEMIDKDLIQIVNP
jgi:hypothetical protein